MSIFERKKQLVKTRLQLKVISAFVGIAAVASLFQVILLNRSITMLAAKMPQDGDVLLAELPGIMRTTTLLCVAFLVPFMLGVGLVLTHRIAGPIYRFEAYLTKVATGEHEGPVKIRKGDELQELCDRINHAVGSLESRGTEEQPGRRKMGGQQRDAA